MIRLLFPVFFLMQLSSNAQNFIASSDRVEKYCPTARNDKNLNSNQIGIVLVRGVLNLNGDVISQKVVYSSADEKLVIIATENFKNCLFQIETSEQRNASVIKAYKWSTSKSKGITLHSEQILRKDKDCSRPEYPEASKRREEEGRVDLSFQLDDQDYVSAVVVSKSSGFSELDTQSIVQLISCKRKPISGEKKWQTTFYAWSLR